MGYKSAAQRKAVHASKADGGKGNPNKLKVKGFDFKSKKAKNKRDYTAKEEKDFSMHNISARRTEGTIEQQNALRKKDNTMFDKKGPSVLYKKYCGKGNPDKVLKGTTPSHFTVTRIQA